MWSGHSCPLPMTLICSLTWTVKINPKVKSGGQECPPHSEELLRCEFVAQRLPQRGLPIGAQLGPA